VRTRPGSLPIVLHRLFFFAQVFVGLADQALDEGIVLIRLVKFVQRGFEISPIKCNVAFQVGEELSLLGDGALVEDCLSRSDVFLRFP